MRVAVLTISDARRAASGPTARATRPSPGSSTIGGAVAARAVVPDDVVAIVRQLVAWCDGDDADLVLTTGGTGLSPRDVTPEATRAVLEREAPGIAERMRAVTGATFPRAALSRGIAGVRGQNAHRQSPRLDRAACATGSPPSSRSLDHAVDIVRGDVTSHDAEQAARAGVAPMTRSSSRSTTSSPRCGSTRASRATAHTTALVSPLDDIRAAIKRAKPDLIVFTGELHDPANVALVREQLWDGSAVVGLADSDDPAQLERLRALGFVDVFPKPIVVDDVADSLRAHCSSATRSRKPRD